MKDKCLAIKSAGFGNSINKKWTSGCGEGALMIDEVRNILTRRNGKRRYGRKRRSRAQAVVPPAAEYTPPTPQQITEEPAKAKKTKTKFCTSCGKPVEEGAAFCPNCGNKLI